MANCVKLLIFATLAATAVQAEVPFASPSVTPGHISPVPNGCLLVQDPSTSDTSDGLLLEVLYKDHLTGDFLTLPKATGRFDVDLNANKNAHHINTWDLVEDIGTRVAPKPITYGSLSVNNQAQWSLTKEELPVMDSFIDWYDPNHELDPEVRKLMARYTHESGPALRQPFATLTGSYTGQCLRSFPSVGSLDVYFRGNVSDNTRVYFANGVLVDASHFRGTWLYLNFLEAGNWLPLEWRI